MNSGAGGEVDRRRYPFNRELEGSIAACPKI